MATHYDRSSAASDPAYNSIPRLIVARLHLGVAVKEFQLLSWALLATLQKMPLVLHDLVERYERFG